MEVSNVQDHVTHAVISSGKAIDFGISDSPEFFHILSSTLYSDQPLAVVREVLCNAWDAHIESGRANKPVEVTLTDDELVIRDFGHGISDDQIGPIYGVYGGSTKKKNKLVTGGFGLGCKAPFAYTDHFEVTSWHAGKKTIYNLSKSSAEVNGRPGIIPIASFPTDESGLQVRIGIKDRYDQQIFQTLIKRIAANGEMSVTLNGNAVDVLPFSSMKHGFMVTRMPVTATDIHRVLIRYGHVIYPVEKHDDYASEYRTVIKFLESLPNYSGVYKIIFQAKPDSISVTPSRESLSMQEHTIKSLTSIFQNFADFLDTRLQDECFNVLQSSIVETWVRMKPADLFSTQKAVPGLSRVNIHELEPQTAIMVELPIIARAQVCWNYPEYRNFRYRDLIARLDSMIQTKFGNTGLINSFRAELIRNHRKGFLFGAGRSWQSPWLHRKVIAPLMLELKAAGLNPKKLMIYGKVGSQRRFSYHENGFIEAAKYECGPLESYLPFLRNVVVLTHNREDVIDRVDAFPVMKNWLGRGREILCYTVPRNSKKVDQAREFFKAQNVELIDLTFYHPWEEAPVQIAAPKEKPKARPKGLPILGSLLNGGIRMDFLDFPDEERDIKRTTKPKVVVQISRRKESITHISDFSWESTEAICALWPNDIAVAVSSTQLLKYTADGAADLRTWVTERVCTEVQSNKRIHQAIANDINRVKELRYNPRFSDLVEVILADSKLSKTFGLVNKLTETDKLYLTLWYDIENWNKWRNIYPEIKKTAEIIDKIEIEPAILTLSALLETRRKFVDLLSMSTVRHNLLSTGSSNPETVETTRKIVLLALKG